MSSQAQQKPLAKAEGLEGNKQRREQRWTKKNGMKLNGKEI